jgi:hypothetical protein
MDLTPEEVRPPKVAREEETEERIQEVREFLSFVDERLLRRNTPLSATVVRGVLLVVEGLLQPKGEK